MKKCLFLAGITLMLVPFTPISAIPTSEEVSILGSERRQERRDDRQERRDVRQEERRDDRRGY